MAWWWATEIVPVHPGSTDKLRIWGFGYTGQRVGPAAQAAGRLQAPSVRPTVPKHRGWPRTGGQAGWTAMLGPWESRAASLLS